MGTMKQRFLKLAAVFLELYKICLFMIASGRLVISSIVDFKGGMEGIALIFLSLHASFDLLKSKVPATIVVRKTRNASVSRFLFLVIPPFKKCSFT